MKHLKIFENFNFNDNDFDFEEYDDKFIDFIEKQENIFILIKKYLTKVKPELNKTKLEIVRILKLEYSKFGGNMSIWFKYHREHLDFKIEIYKLEAKELISFINENM